MGQDKKQKLSRKERERRMSAEMDAAMWGNKPAGETDKANGGQTTGQKEKVATGAKKNAGQKLHCPRCKTLMENGKCPNCGHYVYVPMDREKRSKIRLIVGGVCIVGFLILFVILQGNK